MSLRLDRANTIIDCLEYYADICEDKDAYIFLTDGESQAVHMSYKQLHTRATALAQVLEARKLSGKTVLLLYPAGLEFLVSFIACLYAGAIAVPANLARNSRHFVRLKNIMLDSNCAAVLTLPTFQDTIRSNLALAGVDMQHIAIVSEEDSAPQQSAAAFTVTPDAIAFIQYTSGSTGHPKGVIVTHANLIANERAIQQSSNLPEFMVGAGWLPQFHDMGLIGNLLQPMAVGGTYIFMSPLHFIQAPLRWIKMLSTYRAHASAAPCFALEMCVAAAKDGIDPNWDLSAMGTIFCGAEPINQRILERFQTCFAHIGMPADAVKPCYGMAETTLIISGGLPSEAERSLKIDRDALQCGNVVLQDNTTENEHKVQDIVCCGTPVNGHEIIVVCPETQQICLDNAIGEIWCRGPSITTGYWQKPEATAHTFHAFTACGQGPWLRTGDLGFKHKDGLYVTGRIKEIMILRGKNHYPHDIENTINTVFANHNMKVQTAVFMEHESSSQAGIVAIAELPRRVDDQAVELFQKLTHLARQHVSQEHDLLLKDTLIVKHGSIPRTSSGKVQRLLCARLYQSGDIQAQPLI